MSRDPIRPVKAVGKTVVKMADKTFDEVGAVAGAAEQTIEKTVAPVRESVIKRFPIVFMLAVTFGLTAVVTGMERIMLRYELLQNHPVIILGIGLLVLVATGTAYKKLG